MSDLRVITLLRDHLRQLEQQRDELDREIESARTALKAVEGLENVEGTRPFPSTEENTENSGFYLLQSAPMATSQQPRLSERQTIKKMVVSVLRDRSGRGTAEQIIEWIRDDFGSKVARTSLSPQLSRLKSEGQLDLDQSTNTWGLPEVLRD